MDKKYFDMDRTARESFFETEIDNHKPFERICSEAEKNIYEEMVRFMRKMALGDEDIDQILSRARVEEFGQILKAYVLTVIIKGVESHINKD